MSYHVEPLTALDPPARAVLTRALSVEAMYDEDVPDLLRMYAARLAAGDLSGLQLVTAAGVPRGIALWRAEEAGPEYVAVEILYVDGDDPAAAEALVGGLWAVLTADPALRMISVRVREGAAIRAALVRREAVIFVRLMMDHHLCEVPKSGALPEGWALARWEEAHQSAVEALAVRVQQAGSVDAVIMPDALPERIAEAVRRIRAGTYPGSGPCIPAATLVALDAAGDVAGYIACVDMGLLAFVMDVAVHPAHQGRGIGRALMAAALAALQARDDSYPLVALAVSALNPAVRLYESLGFREVERGETAIWWYDRRQLVWQSDR